MPGACRRVCASGGKNAIYGRIGVDVPTAPQSQPDQPSFAYAVGDVIAGKYALEELLGEGGMGAVFRARNTAIDMFVAIKLIRTDLNRELLSGRLLQEARAAAKLNHPAIVRVFDVGQTALGDPFIVMELLEGESLSAIIDRDGRLTATRAVQMLLPIADALSAAHAKGFVHRDVKPDNVFIVHDEGALQPKLVDFGIVKLAEHDGNSQLTQVGAVLGSPEYMSPEQARGLDHIDLRSDVWSFSIMLYEAIHGETPFTSANYNALLRMIVETEPATLRELSAADDALSSIVARGMSKAPADRFGSLGAMGKALAAWLAEQGITDDICGISLETKWLARQTDPNGPGRSSRPSVPDGWFEPTSGVRHIGRTFATAPTLQASRPAGTPVSLAPMEAGVRRHLRSRSTGAAALALVAVVAAVWLAFARSTNEAQPAAAAVPIERPATREPQTAALTPSSAQIAPSPVAPVGVPSASLAPSNLPAPHKPTDARPRAGASDKSGAAPPPTPPDKPAPAPATDAAAASRQSDLIAPY